MPGLNWDCISGDKIDLGTDAVNLYMHLQGFPPTCAVLEIAREEVRNAIDRDTALALWRGLDELDKFPEVRTLFLTGRGHKAFISGGDLRDYAKNLHTVKQVQEALDQMRKLLWRIYTGARFVIAVINGPARGGGSELAFSCHYRVMAEHASIGFIQVRQGILPGWGGGTLLANQVGMAKARYALQSGTIIHSDEALKMGFVDEVAYSEDQMIKLLKHIADQFADSTPEGSEAVAGLMRTLYDHMLIQMEKESAKCAELWFAPAHRKVLEKYS